MGASRWESQISGVEKVRPSAKQPQTLPADQRKWQELALVPQSPSNPGNPAGGKSAARDAAQQDVFLREVDEALRQDEMLTLVQRYGKPIGLAVGAGLLGLAGYLWWDHAQNQAAAERSERLTLAVDRLEAGSLDAAAKDLEGLSKEGSGGNKAVAAMLHAGILQQQGKTADAARAFAAIAADSSAPQPYRDLATIREVAAQYDTLAPEKVIERLKPLAVPGNPWFGSAGEMVGLAYLKQGRNDLAGPLFVAVAKDKAVPDTIRSRCRQIAGMLGFDAIDDVARAAADGGVPPAGAAVQP